jgi:anti-sigma B factor antagonist
VVLTGVVDVDVVPRVRQRLDEVIGDGRVQLVVDLQEVSVLDETVLGVLVGVWRKIRARGGWLHVVCAPGHVLDRFRVTGLVKVFPVYPTVEAALAGP